MTATTSDRNTLRAVPDIQAYPVAASTKIPAGTLVSINSSGYAVPAADTSGHTFVGVARALADNSGSAVNGAINVEVWRVGTFKFGYGGTVAITLVGQVAYAADNQTLNAAGSLTNDIRVGVISQVDVTAGQVWVDIGR